MISGFSSSGSARPSGGHGAGRAEPQVEVRREQDREERRLGRDHDEHAPPARRAADRGGRGSTMAVMAQAPAGRPREGRARPRARWRSPTPAATASQSRSPISPTKTSAIATAQRERPRATRRASRAPPRDRPRAARRGRLVSLGEDEVARRPSRRSQCRIGASDDRDPVEVVRRRRRGRRPLERVRRPTDRRRPARRTTGSRHHVREDREDPDARARTRRSSRAG